jgi:hypothetical protein
MQQNGLPKRAKTPVLDKLRQGNLRRSLALSATAAGGAPLRVLGQGTRASVPWRNVPLKRRIVAALVFCVLLLVLGLVMASGFLDGVVASYGFLGGLPALTVTASATGIAGAILAPLLASMCALVVLIHSNKGPVGTLWIAPALQIGFAVLMGVAIPYLPSCQPRGVWATYDEAQVWLTMAGSVLIALAGTTIGLTFWAAAAGKAIVTAVPCFSSDGFEDDQSPGSHPERLRVFCPYCHSIAVVPNSPGLNCGCPKCQSDFLVPSSFAPAPPDNS